MERLNYYNPAIKFDRKALTEVWEILNEYEEGIDEIPGFCTCRSRRQRKRLG